MIKMGKVQINLMIIPLILMSAFTGTLYNTAIAYLVVSIHEFAHFLAAKKCRVEVGGLAIMPFGVNLRLKENYVKKPIHDISICIAGPLSNFVMILIGLIIKNNGGQAWGYIDFFIFSNVAIMAINTIPILPLDGGRLLKAFFTQHYGFIKAFKITNIISKINIVLILILGLAILWYTHFNVSVAVLSAFLIFNMSAEKESNDYLMMQQLINAPQKLRQEGIMPVKTLAVMKDTSPAQLLKNFSYNHFYIINVCDDNATVIGTLSETQIIRAMTGIGKSIQIGDILDEILLQ